MKLSAIIIVRNVGKTFSNAPKRTIFKTRTVDFRT